MQRACSPKYFFSVIRLAGLAMAVAIAGCASGADRAGGPASPREQMQGGIQAHQARDYESAIAAFRQVTEMADADRETVITAWANLGAAYDAAARYQEALDALEEARKLAPDRPQIHFNLGRVYTNLGRFADARTSYLKAAELQPGNTDIPYNLGILYEIYLNQPDQALAAYRKYIDMGGPEASRVQGWIAAIEQRGQAK